MSEALGILRAGVHVPRLRLARARIAEAMSWTRPDAERAPSGTRAIANWDEDALTLAVEAARGCLGQAGAGSASGSSPARAGAAVEAPARIVFSSTTAPFADRDNAVLIATALDLPEATRTSNVGSTQRAATGALVAELESGARLRSLVVASDLRLARPGSAQDMSYGDAAAALLVGPAGTGSLASILAAHSIADDFVDHYRMSGQRFDYALEERWIRDEGLSTLVPRAVAALLDGAGVRPADIRHLALPLPEHTARRVDALCGLEKARRDTRVAEHCGDAGAAAPLLALIAALEHAQRGEHVLLLGIGQGVDALLLRVEDGVQGFDVLTRALAAGREERSYTRYLAHRGLLEVDFGMRAERDQRTAHSVAWRKREQLGAFRGGR